MPLKFEKITDAHRGAAFAVRIVTRASKVEVAGVQDDGILKIRLTEAHTDGAADKQLVQFLAEKLSVEAAKIEIVASNKTERLISVDGVSPEDVEELLIP